MNYKLNKIIEIKNDWAFDTAVSLIDEIFI